MSNIYFESDLVWRKNTKKGEMFALKPSGLQTLFGVNRELKV